MKRSAAAVGLLLGLQFLLPPLMARTLKVGVSGSAPFVIQEEGGSSGISLQVWRRIAEDNNLSYRLIQQATPQKGILALNDGEIDLLVGPISVTPDRLNLPGVDFTQPYFIGKEGILLPLKPSTLLNRLQVFLGWAVLSSVLVLITVLLVVGSLIWLAERRSNSEQFPAQPLPGIASGMWFALVTLTTVGYGDKAPITRIGRGLTAIWMVTSLIAVSSLTASLASAFTLFLSGDTNNSITDPAQLSGQRAAVLEGTSGAELARQRNMRIVPAKTLTAAIDHVLMNRAEAVIFDRPAIRFHLKNNPELAVQLAPFTLAEQTYGFAFRTGDPLRTPLNISILKLQRSGAVEAISKRLLN
ncbi:putative ligand gated channel (GIC family) [Synechococcus sp. BOUM118]|nr:putative ligand gated channel (GIC family) [Synechococcus sp. BOUM118]